MRDSDGAYMCLFIGYMGVLLTLIIIIAVQLCRG